MVESFFLRNVRSARSNQNKTVFYAMSSYEILRILILLSIWNLWGDVQKAEKCDYCISIELTWRNWVLICIVTYLSNYPDENWSSCKVAATSINDAYFKNIRLCQFVISPALFCTQCCHGLKVAGQTLKLPIKLWNSQEVIFSADLFL